MAKIVVYPCWTRQDNRHIATLLADEALGQDFRFPIRQLGVERPVFVDGLTVLAWRVHEHGADKYELLELEFLEAAQQASGSFHCDGLVLGIWLTGEIEIGCQMNHRRDTAPVSRAQPLQRCRHTVVLSQIDAHTFRYHCRMWRGFAVESHDAKSFSQLFDYCRTDKAAASRHHYDVLLRVWFDVTVLQKTRGQRFMQGLRFFCFHNTPP